MKKVLLIIGLILTIQCGALAIEDATGLKTFTNEKNLWGLKDSNGVVLIEPQYKKLIILGNSSYIVQKGSKFGLVDFNGNILVPIKYSHVERVFTKYLKIGNGSKTALYNEKGEQLLPMEYSSIDILFGGMFLTCKNYKYGIVDNKGNVILDNKFDDIYMPKPNLMRIKYQSRWYEIEQVKGEELSLPDDVKNIKSNKNYIVSEITEHPATVASYSAVTFTDYLIKIFSSVSPAHEETIDSLMLSQGADALAIYFKFGWLVKYPFVFTKNYYHAIKNPNNGPLSDVKNELKEKMQ